MEAYPFEEKVAQMKRGNRISALSIVLMLLSVYPLAHGLVGKNLWLSVSAGTLMAISIVSLFISVYRMKSASDEMLRESEAELTEMREVLVFVKTSSSSQHLH